MDESVQRSLTEHRNVIEKGGKNEEVTSTTSIQQIKKKNFT